MTDVNLIIVLVVAGTAMALFATGRLRIDLIALCVLVALIALGLINANQALYGLTSPATATIAAMFVLSAGLARTGLVQWFAQKIDGLAGKTESRLILVLCAVVRIPEQTGHHSGANRPPFRSKPATLPEQIGHPWGKVKRGAG